MRPDPDATPEGKVDRLEKDTRALATLVEEQQAEIEALKQSAWSARTRLWYKVGRKLGLLPEIRPDIRPDDI
ncbi:MAG: hypothetical protein AAF108_11200 [Planctomycetota bacterium]